jgi:aspartate dehydrogenase
VKLVVDPKATKNTHRLIVKGKFGEIEAWTRNEAFPSNPRTSYLAALSAISAIKKIAGTVWVGV